MMKRQLIVIFVIIALTGCGTTHSIVKEVSHDTLYVNTIQYDSVYIDQWHSQEYHPSTLHSSPSTLHLVDTIYLEKVRLEYKYRFLRDTVRVVQVDSVPVIREVQVTKTERYVPSIYKWSLAICIILLILLIIYIVWKIKF